MIILKTKLYNIETAIKLPINEKYSE